MRYFISDCHFDHTNIIRYCSRPFTSTDAMNAFMLDKWNATIGQDDVVYFLGDLTFGRGRRHIDWWLAQLTGHIVFVAGSHDTERSQRVTMHQHLEINLGGHALYLVHNPEEAPNSWDGWIIHGHHHANYPDRYPFVNRECKRINVSTEVVDYTPVSENRILEVINQ